MSNVPNQPIARRVEYPMEGNGQLHDPEACPEMPAGSRHDIYGFLPQLIGELEQLGILVDGQAKGAYLLQIFLKDSAGLYGSAEAGPFFFELITRKGDQGFGAGNFRALFESIELDQIRRGVLSDKTAA